MRGVQINVMLHPRILATFATLLLFVTLPSAASEQRLPPTSNFLHTHCDGHRRVYQPLVNSQLAPYRFGGGLSTKHILDMDATGNRVALVYNNTVMTGEAPAFNMEAYWVPLVRRIAEKVTLPDLVLAGDMWDYPEDDTATAQGGPWFGYCNIAFMTSNLMLPAGGGVSHLGCGKHCKPFTSSDLRESKAAFLGSSTGWLVGRRRAAVLAGILHNDTVYSGYTQIIDVPGNALPEGDTELAKLKPSMTMPEQVMKYKYIINADGHCAALRMRQLLASDSAVFWVESNQIEWFYPLLQPYVHYIPVRYFDYEPDDPLRDIVNKVAWAEQHPEKIRVIVANANRFASTHLSEHAFTCYSVHMLDEYARLFHDPQQLQSVAGLGKFSTGLADSKR